MTKLKSLADKRHHVIHGEWWFNVFENGQREIRAVRQGKIKHMSTVSAHDLGQWALELDDIADVLDDIEFYCRTACGRRLNEAKRFSQGLALHLTVNSHAGSERTGLPLGSGWPAPSDCSNRSSSWRNCASVSSRLLTSILSRALSGQPPSVWNGRGRP
jgi:hypothetical protein